MLFLIFLQIQFTIMILHSLIALQPSCDVPKHVLMIYLPNVILIYKMFYDFYQKAYVVKNKVGQKNNRRKK